MLRPVGTRIMPNPKDVLTTGDVARICNVAPRTVSKWFDSGQLRGYRIPGSKDRRIPLAQLVRFMKAHGMPLSGLETGRPRVLVIDPDEEFGSLLATTLTRDDRCELRTAPSMFEGGVAACDMKPHVILVDVSVPGFNARQMQRVLRSHDDLADAKLVATGGGLTPGHAEAYRQEGFEASFHKPFDIQELMQKIDELAGVAV